MPPEGSALAAGWWGRGAGAGLARGWPETAALPVSPAQEPWPGLWQVLEGADDRRDREARWAQVELLRSPRVSVCPFTENEVLLCKVPRSLINLKLTYLSPLLLCYLREVGDNAHEYHIRGVHSHLSYYCIVSNTHFWRANSLRYLEYMSNTFLYLSVVS